MADFRLTENQQAAVDHRGGALLISAGAGSGKTRVLVERLMDLLLKGTPDRDELPDVDRFLVITFTKAAAAELRGRILEAIRDRLRTEPGNRRLRRQILLLRQARIGTIHSFCSSLIRENAHLLGVRPDFRQLEGAEETVLRQEILQEVLAGRYENMTSSFRALADALDGGTDDRVLTEAVLETYRAVQSHPDPEEWLRRQLEAPLFTGDAGDTIWGRELLDRARRRAAFWKEYMETTLEELEDAPEVEARYGPSVRETVSDLEDLSRALDLGWDAAAAFGEVSFPKLNAYRGKDPAAARARDRRARCKKALETLLQPFAEESAVLEEDMAAVRPITDELLSLVLDFSEAFTAEKRRRGLLDFNDLEHLALQLLTEKDGAGRRSPSALGREIGGRFDEILVDEYQDCNRVQDEIFFALSREGRNVTMVGDVKQSIYRFRLADPGMFLEKYRSYADKPSPSRGRRILLSENFRSDAGILRPVNGFFSAVMSRELGELDYGEKEALLPGPDAGDTEGAFRLFVVENGEDGLRSEAEAAAGYVAWLLQSGMTVPDRDGPRPLRPEDVALLLRAGRGNTVYAEALLRHGIPSASTKSEEDLGKSPEVRWLLNLLQAVDNPRQDVPLLAALRSPVFRFTEERLAELRAACREGCFYEALAAAGEEDCREALAKLERWRQRAAVLPAEELLEEICGEESLWALAEASEPGAAARLDALIEAARGFAESGRQDLYSFLDYLREAGSAGKTALTAAGGGSGVRISTIHGSKGLEYPVVILADLMHRFNDEDKKKPVVIHPRLGLGAKRIDRKRGITYATLAHSACTAQLAEESRSEELRVLYVAMTRARQHLALFCRVGDAEEEKSKRKQAEILPLPPELLEKARCPGDWILDASLALGGEDWAWRDPPRAETAAAAEEPEKADRSVSPDLVRARLEWKYPRAADTRLPSKLTATALRAGFAAAEAAEGAGELPLRRYGERDFPALSLGKAALTPAEKGSAVHLALQYADLDACGTAEGAAAELRRLGEVRLLTAGQLAAVEPEKLRAFCAGPVMALLRRGKVHREFKFSLLAPLRELLGEGEGETLLQGVVDLWSELPEGLILLDYKTDRVTRETQNARAAEYEPQLRAYAWALERITGKRVLRRFLWFFATGESVEI